MPSFFFYLFIGFISALLAEYGKRLGPVCLALLILFNVLAFAMYYYANRLRQGARNGDEIRPAISEFLLLAPICYVAGFAVGLSIHVY